MRLIMPALLLLLGTAPQAATLTVDTTSSNPGLSACTAAAGDCSFAGALLHAQGTSAGEDTIVFDIPASDPNCDANGVCGIVVDTGLLYFGGSQRTEGLTIDGYSQPGASPNSLPLGQGSNAQLKIVLRRPAVGSGSLTFQSAITIRGIVFQVPLVYQRDGALCCGTPSGSSRYELFGNFFGTTADGLALSTPTTPTMDIAFFLSQSFGNVDGGRIGSADPADMNVFAGAQEGMRITGSRHHVMGNLIGTDRTGLAPLGNLVGISSVCGGGCVSGNCLGGCRIGGPGAGEGNVISGNRRTAFLQNGSETATRTLVQGNLIGVGVDGVTPLPNVLVAGATPEGSVIGSPGVRLGGTAPGEGNLIAHSGLGRPTFPSPPLPNRQSPGMAGARWEILGNRFVGNRGLAIDIGGGNTLANGRQANDAGDGDDAAFDRLQNFPLISQRGFPAAGQVALTYRVDSAFADPPAAGQSRYPLHIEFYRADGSGGDALIGTDTYTSSDAQQDKTVVLPIPSGLALDAGDVIVATATDRPGHPDSTGHTSEFSFAPMTLAFVDPPTTVQAGVPVTFTVEAVATAGPFSPNGVVLFGGSTSAQPIPCEERLTPTATPNTSRASCTLVPTSVGNGRFVRALYPTTLGAFGSAAGLDVQIDTFVNITAPDPEQVSLPSCLGVALEGRDLIVDVRRPSGGVATVQVDLQHQAGTATPGVDYIAPPDQTLTWGPGDIAPKLIVIPITSDGTGEPVETFRLRLVNPLNTAIIPHALIEYRILDGDDRGFMDGFEGSCPSS